MYKSEVYGKGGIQAKVVCHSVANGEELITFQLKAPKFLDAEFEKHRMISSNSSSDRAIPLIKMLEKDYFLPQDLRLNQAGMQGFSSLEEQEKEMFHEDLKALYGHTGEVLKKWNKIHKQHLNRYLLGFSYQEKVATANRSSFEHFFSLRLHEAADPAMYELARCMKVALEQSEAEEMFGELGCLVQLHLPYVTEEEKTSWWGDKYASIVWADVEKGLPSWAVLARLSSARCARSSYMKHDNSNPSFEEDLELYNQLATRPYTDKRGFVHDINSPKHLSPLEHCAKPMRNLFSTRFSSTYSWEEGVSHMDKNGEIWSGNFKSWVQYRKLIEG